MKRILFLLIAGIMIAGCSNYVYDLRGKFDESLTQYNNLFRWRELGATSMFAAESIRDQFMARAKAGDNVRIVDCRVIATRFDEEKRRASIDMEVDYYFISSTRLKTLRDTQEWVYTEEKGIKAWRITSLLPVFH